MLKASFAVFGASGCGRGVLPLVRQQLAQRAETDGVHFFEARAANVVQLDEVAIGPGAVLKQGKPGQPLVIGKGAVVGMGAVVTKSVAPGTTVVGNPARVMER